jgi:hypothetical protein
MNTLADRIIAFNRNLRFDGKLPEGIRIMNPFRENEQALGISSAFYQKYYNDNQKRFLILGINPGRFGAGLTGVPFTDPKRIENNCGIDAKGMYAHEPSSVFIYDMIKAYGGEELFFSRFYIHAICPLGFTAINNRGKEINYNYYDNPQLQEAMYEFIVDNIKTQINMGVYTHSCFFLGTGKNQKFLQNLNNKFHFFESLVGLEHPRFIMQYKTKQKNAYIEKSITEFEKAIREL